MHEQRTEIRQGEPNRQEKFLLFDFKRLMQDLNNFALDFTQTIFNHILKESREELNSLLNDFKTIV